MPNRRVSNGISGALSAKAATGSEESNTTSADESPAVAVNSRRMAAIEVMAGRSDPHRDHVVAGDVDELANHLDRVMGMLSRAPEHASVAAGGGVVGTVDRLATEG